MWRAWFTFLIGLWMILSGLVPALAVGGNFIVAGALLAIFGFWSRGWQGTINGVIGLWLVLSGILPSLIAPGNAIVTGAVVAVLAIWQTAAQGRHQPQTATQ
jgi:hypothetical protein